MARLQGGGAVDQQADHADLWNLLAAELQSRNSCVSVTWVKGHATRLDIARGRSSEADKFGNDAADVLAVAGAWLHAVSNDIVGKSEAEAADCCRHAQHDACHFESQACC